MLTAPMAMAKSKNTEKENLQLVRYTTGRPAEQKPACRLNTMNKGPICLPVLCPTGALTEHNELGAHLLTLHYSLTLDLIGRSKWTVETSPDL